MPTFRILLDECLDRRVSKQIPGYEVMTASEMGWAGLDNGELLARAEKDFDVFITVDRNLSFQQNLPKFDLAVLVLRARTNRLKDLIPLVPKIIAALNKPEKGKAVFIDG